MSRAAEAHRARRQIQRGIQEAHIRSRDGATFADDDHPSTSIISKKNQMPMRVDGNFNLDPILAANITRSDYYRSLGGIQSFQQAVDEIYHHVTHLEPWTNAGGKVPSSAYCLLYKLCELGLTTKQMQCLLEHKDSPYIRAVGFLFLRFTCPPHQLWDWFSAYMLDEEKIAVERQRPERFQSVSELLSELIERPKFLGSQLPRLPHAIETDLKVQILKARAERERFHENVRRKAVFKAGSKVSAKFSEDGQWYDAVILKEPDEDGMVQVKYTEYQNEELVSLGAIMLANEERDGERRQTRRGTSRSPSPSSSSRNRRRSRSRSRSRRRRSRSRSRSNHRRPYSRSRSRSRERRRRGDSRSRSPRRESRRYRSRSNSRDSSFRRGRHERDSYDRRRGNDERRTRLDEENDEVLRRRVMSEGRNRAQQNDRSRTGRRQANYQRSRSPRRTETKSKEEPRQESAEKESRKPMVDPEIIARRQAELERVKQRYQ